MGVASGRWDGGNTCADTGSGYRPAQYRGDYALCACSRGFCDHDDRPARPRRNRRAGQDGALEKLSIIRVTNLARALDSLKEAGFILVGLEAGGTTALDPFAAEPRLGLVLGSEGAGMRRLTREGCDHLAAIPISPDSESLNVSVAAAIALYATSFKEQSQ